MFRRAVAAVLSYRWDAAGLISADKEPLGSSRRSGVSQSIWMRSTRRVACCPDHKVEDAQAEEVVGDVVALEAINLVERHCSSCF